MNTSGILLSVVVPTYRRPENLLRFLKAICPQLNSERSLVVINDGSHDHAYERVINQFKEIIDYLPLPQNCGPALARNKGAAHSKGKYLVFTDDDCIPPENWLNTISNYLAVFPDIAVVGVTAR